MAFYMKWMKSWNKKYLINMKRFMTLNGCDNGMLLDSIIWWCCKFKMYRELLFKRTNVCIQLKSLKWYEMGKRTCMILTNGLDKNGKWLW